MLEIAMRALAENWHQLAATRKNVSSENEHVERNFP
jgi:hypothetical protein